MKSYRKELWFRVPSRRGLVNITGEVEKALEESGVQEGLVLVNAMNITASVFINDDEPGLHRDLEAWLEKLAPEKPYGQYRHNGYEDNADAHLKRSVMGREAVARGKRASKHTDNDQTGYIGDAGCRRAHPKHRCLKPHRRYFYQR